MMSRGVVGSTAIPILHRVGCHPFHKLAVIALFTTAASVSVSAFHPPSSLSLRPLRTFTNMSTSGTAAEGDASATATANTPIVPPIARREEDRTVLAGLLPDDHPLKSKLIRQSETSNLPLLDPPRHIPDPYGWMRDESRTVQEVVDHLNAENKYTEDMTSHLSTLRGDLYKEMLGSIQETDYTLPANKDDQYYYYVRTNEGESYAIYCRAPVPSGGAGRPSIEWDGTKESPILPGEVAYLNVNELAKDKSYCSVRSSTTSKSQKLLAYAVDYTGDEIYTLVVKNLDTNEIIYEDPTMECYGSVRWGADENTIYYLKLDDAQRPYQVYRKTLDGSKEDELLFEQLDGLYWTGISKSSDERYLFISTSSSETSEVYYIDLKEGNGEVKLVAKKRTKVLYDVEHWNGHWIITSNVDETPNMRFMTCKVGEDETAWKDVTMINPESGEEERLFDGGYEKSLDGIDAFKDYLVAAGRFGGIPRVWVMKLNTETETDTTEMEIQTCTQLTFDEDAYDVGVSVNYNYDTDRLVLYYDSMTTPLQSLEVSMSEPDNKDARNVLKAKNVPGYVKADYDCQRITVTSRDGTTEIPVSIVYRRDVMEKHLSSGETVPVHLIGYGSYGASSEADFSATRLTLLNRGIVYVVAHIRGGGEMGRQWYEEPNGAKYLCKENTFNDFVDIAKWLTDVSELCEMWNVKDEI